MTGPSALIAAGVAHLRMSSEQICADGNSPGCEVLQTWGALGVMLKAFSTLDYLRSFRSTGPLVRMLHIISYDVLRKFLFVCVHLLSRLTCVLARILKTSPQTHNE